MFFFFKCGVYIVSVGYFVYSLNSHYAPSNTNILVRYSHVWILFVTDLHIRIGLELGIHSLLNCDCAIPAIQLNTF